MNVTGILRHLQRFSSIKLRARPQLVPILSLPLCPLYILYMWRQLFYVYAIYKRTIMCAQRVVVLVTAAASSFFYSKYKYSVLSFSLFWIPTRTSRASDFPIFPQYPMSKQGLGWAPRVIWSRWGIYIYIYIYVYYSMVRYWAIFLWVCGTLLHTFDGFFDT